MNEVIVVILDRNQIFKFSDKRIQYLIERWREVIVVCLVEWELLTIDEKVSSWISYTIIQWKYISCIEFLSAVQSKIFAVLSFWEKNVLLTNTLRKDLWLVVTPYYEMFNSKNIQREFFNGSDLLKIKSVNYTLEKMRDMSAQEIEKDIWFPCILKPSWWAASINVHKIESINDFEKNRESILCGLNDDSGYIFDKILIEEYLVWQMMSIDYYVDAYWSVSYSYPIFQYTSDDCFSNWDFAIVRQRIWIFIEQYFDLNQLKFFIEETVKVCDIKNTFIHHELKYNQIDKNFKTIEINWRIWWNRLVVYNTIMGLNLYDLMLSKRDLVYQWEKFGSIIKLYPSSLKWKLAHRTQEFTDLLWLWEEYIYKKVLSRKTWKILWPARENWWHLWLLLCEFNNDNLIWYENFEIKLLEFISSDKVMQLVSDYEMIS